MIIMQTSEKTANFLEEARAKAAALHQSIEQALSQGEARMNASLKDNGSAADALYKELVAESATADGEVKQKLAAAAAHAQEASKQAQAGRPRSMLEAAQKLNHQLAEAVASARGSK